MYQVINIGEFLVTEKTLTDDPLLLLKIEEKVSHEQNGQWDIINVQFIGECVKNTQVQVFVHKRRKGE